MKLTTIMVALLFPVFASAYNCTGVDSLGDSVSISTKPWPRTLMYTITWQIGADIHQEIAKIDYWSGSNMGHSRCPGTWEGATFTNQESGSEFTSLSVITDEHFFGCGFALSDSAVLTINGQPEAVSLTCSE